MKGFRDLCKFYSSCNAPMCPISLNLSSVWLPHHDPICHSKQSHNSPLVLKQKAILKIGKMDDWTYYTVPMLLSQKREKGLSPEVPEDGNPGKIHFPREVQWKPPSHDSTAHQVPVISYGHIRGENAPKSSKRTLDDYFPMEVA